MSLLSPLVSFDPITLDECNAALARWGHRMGEINRPDTGKGRYHGLLHDGQLIAVTASDALIASSCAGLTRTDAYELARVCACRPDLCRIIVRLWREFVFPAMSAVHGYAWAVSYQDAVLHRGDLYRHDGWVRLGVSSSGTDQRSGRKGRRKVIWGWHADAEVRRGAAARVERLAA